MICVDVDHRVESPNRLMGEWYRSRAKRRRAEIAATLRALAPHPRPELPVVVTFTRYGPLLLDTDGLVYAFKAPRDAVAEWLGVTDGPLEIRVSWQYAQEKRRELAPPRSTHTFRVWFRIAVTTSAANSDGGGDRCST